MVGVLGDATGVEREEVTNGFTVNIDADSIDQDETANAARVIADRHFGPDPTTERRTDDEDVTQLVAPQIVQVRMGDVGDAREPVRTIGAVPAGVGRGDGVHRCGQMVPDAGHREGAAPTMQNQDGTSRAGLSERDGQVGTEVDEMRGRGAHELCPTCASGALICAATGSRGLDLPASRPKALRMGVTSYPAGRSLSKPGAAHAGAATAVAKPTETAKAASHRTR